MSTSDRREYLTATVLDQDFLNNCHDNLTNKLELIIDIDTPTGTLHLSDRNKYVGSTFYEARLKFPVIKRTIGEFLASVVEFSSLKIEINNADGKYNDILPEGSNFDGWIGREVVVKLGLRDVTSTYKEIFRGKISEQGGFKRTMSSVIFVARNKFNDLNVDFPKAVFSTDVFSNLENDLENVIVPIIYGDWTVNVEENAASIPSFPVNGADIDVNTNFTTNVQFIISNNDNTYFDTSSVFLKRSSTYYPIDSADIVNITDNRAFEMRQKNTTPACTTTIDGQLYAYKTGDRFYVKVKGKDLGSYDDNIIWQARDILINYANVTTAELDGSWETFRDKSSPTESAISTFKSRAWVQDPKKVFSYVLSLLEQVRIEAFIDRNQKIKLSSLHFDDFEASPSFKITNWDIESKSFQPTLDIRNNFNRVKAEFNYYPNRKQQAYETPVFKNSTAITQAGREISKKIIFTNLYEQSVVESQLKEILKLASAYIETINCALTWRSLLLDVGDFVRMSIDIEGTQFDNVPALVRDLGYDPHGIKIPVKLWSMQMLPFPGWAPSYHGITGGYNATIIKET